MPTEPERSRGELTSDRPASRHWEEVRGLLEDGKLEQARVEAERVAREIPESAEALGLIGMVRAGEGELEEAFSALDQALARDPDFLPARLVKAQLLYDEERYEDVVETLDGQKHLDALVLASSALYELGEHDEADAICAEALARDEVPELRHLEALLRLQRAEPEVALLSARRAVELDPDLAGAHHAAGYALSYLGRVEEADLCFAQAAELDPDSYVRPCRLGADEFDEVVEEALSELPEAFQRQLENVEVAVEEVPDAELVREGIEFDILGLYQGGTIQSVEWDFPDRILLFQRNLENISPDRETLIEEIRDTVHHEIAHHMGMDEDAVREAEGDGDS